MAEVYKTQDFIGESANDVQFHVARNILHLRRFRGMSQAAVAQAAGTSQSAVARIESGQENITLDTLRRLVVVLNGRFYVSIPPQECAHLPQRLWWESSDAGYGHRWTVTGYMARRTSDADHLIVGLERPHDVLTGETLTGSGALFLEEGKTN